MAVVSSLSISDHEATAGRAFAVVMASRKGAKEAFFTVSLSSAVLFTRDLAALGHLFLGKRRSS